MDFLKASVLAMAFIMLLVFGSTFNEAKAFNTKDPATQGQPLEYVDCKWLYKVVYTIGYNKSVGMSEIRQVEETIEQGLTGGERMIVWGWIALMYDELKEFDYKQVAKDVYRECNKQMSPVPSQKPEWTI